MIGRAFKDQVLVGVGALFEALCAFIAERAKGGSPIDDELMEIMLTEVGIPGWKRATDGVNDGRERRSEEHTSELQSLMRISYAVFCLKKKKDIKNIYYNMSNIYSTMRATELFYK